MSKYQERGAYHWKAYKLGAPEVGEFARKTHFERYRRYVHHVVDRIVEEFPRADVIDIGCGDGLFTCLLQERGLSVRGFDTDPRGIELAEMKGAQHASVMSLAQASEQLSGDVAIMLDVFEHLESPHDVLRQVFRMAPTLYLTTPIKGQNTKGGEEHVREYTIEELRKLVLVHRPVLIERFMEEHWEKIFARLDLG